MNTSSIRLSNYDIVVALVEGETGKSLHEHVNSLGEKFPKRNDTPIFQVLFWTQRP